MKDREKRIQAWLDFIQADLDALPLDKRVSLIYPIFLDVYINWPLVPLELPSDMGLLSALGTWKTFFEVFKPTLDDPDLESCMLRIVHEPMWKALQVEIKSFFETVLHLNTGKMAGMGVYEYLTRAPSGIFRKGTIPIPGRSEEMSKDQSIARAGIPVLIDILDGIPESAFKRCPECKKWFFHLSKRQKEFCSNRCASRYLTRKKRTESKEAREKYNKKMREYMKKRHQNNAMNPIEAVVVECPGNPDDPQDVEITPTECINPNGRSIRGIWEEVCPTCPHITKEGLPIRRKEE